MRRLVSGVVCHLLMCCSLAIFQPSSQAAAPDGQKKLPESPPAAKPQPVEEAKPQQYYLKDKDGNLQAVPGFTFEDFEKLYKLQQGLIQPDVTPRYSLQGMSASGVAKGEYVELTVEFQVLVRDDNWVRVPLRLDQAVLQQKVQYQGPGQQFLHYEKDGEGYICWIRGKHEQPHRLTLKLLVPVAKVGDETQLRLHAPQATTSELRLKVPLADAVGKVSEGSTLQPPTAVDEKTTELTVLGLSGDFQLSWRKSGGRTLLVPTVLEATGAVLAQIDDRSINTEATLTVRGYGAPFDRFRVRLPKGAELVANTASGYTVIPVTTTDRDAKDQRMVEVRLAKRTSGPVEVRLATQQACKVTEQVQWSELSGFELIGAARQWGHIAVVVAGDLRVLWGPSRRIRQVDELPDPLLREDLVAGFEYSSQPCLLTARVVRRKTRVSVDPEYVLLFEAKRVRLEAKLKYAVRGAKAFSLDVELPGWQFDEVGPENLVAVDGVSMSDSQLLSIPLLQPSTGQIAVSLKAHRDIPADSDSVRLTLPRPQVNLPRPAAVAVLADDNVELTPNAEATEGLVRQQVAPQIDLPGNRQQAPLFYQQEAPESVFATGFRLHEQTVTVDVTSQINLDGKAGDVEQKLAYTIAYEPLDKLTLEVPRFLAAPDKLEVQADGQKLSPAVLPGQDDKGDVSEPVKMRIALPEPRIGLCEIVVRYQLGTLEVPTEKSATWIIPLVMPVEGDLSGNKLYLTVPPTLQVLPRPGLWKEPENGAARMVRRRGLQLLADGRENELALTVSVEDNDGLGSTVIRRAWIQTWLTRNVRQDRAVLRFTTDQKDIKLIMPTGVALDEVDLLLNGKWVPTRATPENHLMIPLTNEANHREHLLELRYHFPGARPPRGQMSLEILRAGHKVWVRRLYWQLILPRDEHVIVAPSGFASEFNWGWNGAFWGRQPLLDQSQLEAWTGAPHRTGRPEETNCYLFSSLGTIGRCELRTASRSWIVLGASGAALVVGLLLIYVPASRHPGTLFAVAVLLLCAGLLYPEPTLLMSQAASLGLALTLLAGLLERSVARRRRGVVPGETSSSILERDSTETEFRPRVAGNQASTDAIPAPMPLTPSDSNS